MQKLLKGGLDSSQDRSRACQPVPFERSREEELIMRRIARILCRLPILACKLLLVCLLSSQAGIMARGVAEAAPASGLPNILFIVMDDVGIDQMRVFGYAEDDQPRTPNIDTIAHAGMRFRNAWALSTAHGPVQHHH